MSTVAKIGSTEYETIQAAFDAVKNGETITILAGDYNEVVTTKLPSNSSLTGVSIIGETDAQGNNLVNWTGYLNLCNNKTGGCYYNTTVKNINFKDNGDNTCGGIWLGQGDTFDIDHCSFDSNGAFVNMIYQSSSYGNGMYGVHVTNSSITGGTNSLRLGNGKGDYNYAAKFENCTLTDTCINMQGATDGKYILLNNTIVKNFSATNQNSIIQAGSDSTKQQASITGGSIIFNGTEKGEYWTSCAIFRTSKASFVGSVDVDGVKFQTNGVYPVFTSLGNGTYSMDNVAFFDADGKLVTDEATIARSLHLTAGAYNFTITKIADKLDDDGNPVFPEEANAKIVVSSVDGVNNYTLSDGSSLLQVCEGGVCSDKVKEGTKIYIDGGTFSGTATIAATGDLFNNGGTINSEAVLNVEAAMSDEEKAQWKLDNGVNVDATVNTWVATIGKEGEEGYRGFFTFKEALDAVKSGETIVIAEGYDVKNEGINHYAVTKSFSIIANGSDFGGGEFFSIGYTVSAADGAPTTEVETTLNITDAKNIYIWGACLPQTDGNGKVWNINLTDCVNEKADMPGMVGIYGGSNDVIVNTTMKNCHLYNTTWGIDYGNGGTVILDGCSFTNCKSPVKLGYEGTNASGRQITIKNCTFDACGCTSMEGGDYAEYAAPIGLKDKGKGGQMKVSVENVAIINTVGNNGDILIGDGRIGKKVVGFDFTLDNKTELNVKVEQAGYYDGKGEVADADKAQTITEDNLTIIGSNAEVFVNDDWANLPEGSKILVPGSKDGEYYVIGQNAFADIQSAVNAAAAENGIVTIYDGTYDGFALDTAIAGLEKGKTNLTIQAAEGNTAVNITSTVRIGYEVSGTQRAWKYGTTLKGLNLISNGTAEEQAAALTTQVGYNIVVDNCHFSNATYGTESYNSMAYLVSTGAKAGGSGNIVFQNGCTFENGYMNLLRANLTSGTAVKFDNATFTNVQGNMQGGDLYEFNECVFSYEFASQDKDDYLLRTNDVALKVTDCTFDLTVAEGVTNSEAKGVWAVFVPRRGEKTTWTNSGNTIAIKDAEGAKIYVLENTDTAIKTRGMLTDLSVTENDKTLSDAEILDKTRGYAIVNPVGEAGSYTSGAFSGFSVEEINDMVAEAAEINWLDATNYEGTLVYSTGTTRKLSLEGTITAKTTVPAGYVLDQFALADGVDLYLSSKDCLAEGKYDIGPNSVIYINQTMTEAEVATWKSERGLDENEYVRALAGESATPIVKVEGNTHTATHVVNIADDATLVDDMSAPGSSEQQVVGGTTYVNPVGNIIVNSVAGTSGGAPETEVRGTVEQLNSNYNITVNNLNASAQESTGQQDTKGGTMEITGKLVADGGTIVLNNGNPDTAGGDNQAVMQGMNGDTGFVAEAKDIEINNYGHIVANITATDKLTIHNNSMNTLKGEVSGETVLIDGTGKLEKATVTGKDTVTVEDSQTLVASTITADTFINGIEEKNAATTMDVASRIKWSYEFNSNYGTITIDTTNATLAIYKVIDSLDGETADYGSVSLKEGSAYSLYEGGDTGDLYVFDSSKVSYGTIAVSCDWSSKEYGDAVKIGNDTYYIGLNAFANMTDASGALTDATQTVLMADSADSTLEEDILTVHNRTLTITGTSKRSLYGSVALATDFQNDTAQVDLAPGAEIELSELSVNSSGRGTHIINIGSAEGEKVTGKIVLLADENSNASVNIYKADIDVVTFKAFGANNTINAGADVNITGTTEEEGLIVNTGAILSIMAGATVTAAKMQNADGAETTLQGTLSVTNLENSGDIRIVGKAELNAANLTGTGAFAMSTDAVLGGTITDNEANNLTVNGTQVEINGDVSMGGTVSIGQNTSICKVTISGNLESKGDFTVGNPNSNSKTTLTVDGSRIGSSNGKFIINTTTATSGSNAITLKNGGYITFSGDTSAFVNSGEISVNASQKGEYYLLVENKSDDTSMTVESFGTVKLSSAMQNAGFVTILSNAGDDGKMNDLYAVKIDYTKLYVDASWSGKTTGDRIVIQSGTTSKTLFYGYNAFSQMADAVGKVSEIKTAGGTSLPSDITVLGNGNVGTKETTANEGTEFTTPGTYNIHGTDWANIGYLQLNPSKATSETRYVLNIADSNLVAIKPQLRGSSDLNITDSHVDFVNQSGASCGYLFAFKDSTVTVKDSVIGYAYDNGNTNTNSASVVAGEESTAGTNGNMKSLIYGVFTADNSTVFAFGGDTRKDAFSIYDKGLAQFKDSVLYANQITIGNYENKTDRDTVGRNDEIATITLDNSKIIDNNGEEHGLVVGGTRSGKLEMTNDSLVDYSNADVTINSNGTVDVSDSVFKAKNITNDASFRISGTSTINAAAFAGDLVVGKADATSEISTDGFAQTSGFTSIYGTASMSNVNLNNLKIGFELSTESSDTLNLSGTNTLAKVWLGQADLGDAMNIAGWENRKYELNVTGGTTKLEQLYLRTTGTVNVDNAEVTTGHNIIYGAVNITNGASYTVDGVNFYVIGPAEKKATDKAIVTVDNATLNFNKAYALELGGGSNTGSGKLVLQNHATANGSNIVLHDNPDGTLGTIAVEATDSTINLTGSLTVGTGDSVSLAGSTMTANSISNNGTFNVTGTSKLNSTSFTGDLNVGKAAAETLLTTNGLTSTGGVNVADGSTVTFIGNGFKFAGMFRDSAEEKNSYTDDTLNHEGYTLTIKDADLFETYGFYVNGKSNVNVTNVKNIDTTYFNVYGGTMNVTGGTDGTKADYIASAKENFNVTGTLNLKKVTASAATLKVVAGSTGKQAGVFTAEDAKVTARFVAVGDSSWADKYYVNGDSQTAVATLTNSELHVNNIAGESQDSYLKVGGDSTTGILNLANSTITCNVNTQFSNDANMTVSANGSVNMANSCITVTNFSNSGTITMDYTSAISTGTFAGTNGMITVDMTGSAAEYGVYRLVDASNTSTYGNYVFAADKSNGYTLTVHNYEDLWAIKADMSTVLVDNTWTTYSYGDAITGHAGYFYGINAFDKFFDAMGTAAANTSVSRIEVLTNINEECEHDYGIKQHLTIGTTENNSVVITSPKAESGQEVPGLWAISSEKSADGSVTVEKGVDIRSVRQWIAGYYETDAGAKHTINFNGKVTLSQLALWNKNTTAISTVNINKTANVHMGHGDGVIDFRDMGNINVTGTLTDTTDDTLNAQTNADKQLYGGYIQVRPDEGYVNALNLTDTYVDQVAWLAEHGTPTGQFSLNMSNAALKINGAITLNSSTSTLNVSNGSRLLAGGAVTLGANVTTNVSGSELKATAIATNGTVNVTSGTLTADSIANNGTVNVSGVSVLGGTMTGNAVNVASGTITLANAKTTDFKIAQKAVTVLGGTGYIGNILHVDGKHAIVSDDNPIQLDPANGYKLSFADGSKLQTYALYVGYGSTANFKSGSEFKAQYLNISAGTATIESGAEVIQSIGLLNSVANITGALNVAGTLTFDGITVYGAMAGKSNSGSMDITGTVNAEQVRIGADIADAKKYYNDGTPAEAPEIKVHGSTAVLNATGTGQYGMVIGGASSNGKLSVTDGAKVNVGDITNTATGTITMDTASQISFAGTWTNTGTLTIDVGNTSGAYKVVDNTGSTSMAVEGYGNLTLSGDKAADYYTIVHDNDLWVTDADRSTYKVNEAWSTFAYGAAIESQEGFYYGINAFSSAKTALESLVANTTTKVEVSGTVTEVVLTPVIMLSNDVTLSGGTINWTISGNDSKAPDTDGMVYILSDSTMHTLTIAKGTTLNVPYTAGKQNGALYIGYEQSKSTELVVNGEINSYVLYLGPNSKLTVNETGKLNTGSEDLIVRRYAMALIDGGTVSWSATNVQADFGYVNLQGGTTTFKNTYIDAGAWINLYNRNNLADDTATLILDKASVTTGAIQFGATEATNNGSVRLTNSSALTVSGAVTVGTKDVFTIDATSTLTAATIANSGAFNLYKGASISVSSGISGAVTLADAASTDFIKVASYTGEGEYSFTDLSYTNEGFSTVVNGNTAYATNASRDIYVVNSEWASSKAYGDEITVGDVTYYYGYSAFSDVGSALRSATASTTDVKLYSDANFYSTDSVTLLNNVTISSGDSNVRQLNWCWKTNSGLFEVVDEQVPYSITFDPSVTLKHDVENSVTFGSYNGAKVIISDTATLQQLWAVNGEFEVTTTGKVTVADEIHLCSNGNLTVTGTITDTTQELNEYTAQLSGGWYWNSNNTAKVTATFNNTYIHQGSIQGAYNGNNAAMEFTFNRAIGQFNGDVNLSQSGTIPAGDTGHKLTLNDQSRVIVGGALTLDSRAKVYLNNSSLTATSIVNGGTVNVTGTSALSGAFAGTGAVNVNNATLDGTITEADDSANIYTFTGTNTINADMALSGSEFRVYFGTKDAATDTTVKGSITKPQGIRIGSDDVEIAEAKADSMHKVTVDGGTINAWNDGLYEAGSAYVLVKDGGLLNGGCLNAHGYIDATGTNARVNAAQFRLNGETGTRAQLNLSDKASSEIRDHINIGHESSANRYADVVVDNATLTVTAGNINIDAAATQNASGSSLTVRNGAAVTVSNAINNYGKVTVDYLSTVTAGTLGNNGSFTVDATGYSTGTYKVVDLDSLSGTDISVTIANDKYVYRNTEGDVVISDASTELYKVDASWSSYKFGEAITDMDGFYYGINAFSDVTTAAKALKNDTATITLLTDSTLDTGFYSISNNLTITAAEGKTLTLTGSTGQALYFGEITDSDPTTPYKTVTFGENISIAGVTDSNHYMISNWTPNTTGKYGYANLEIQGNVNAGLVVWDSNVKVTGKVNDTTDRGLFQNNSVTFDGTGKDWSNDYQYRNSSFMALACTVSYSNTKAYFTAPSVSNYYQNVLAVVANVDDDSHTATATLDNAQLTFMNNMLQVGQYYNQGTLQKDSDSQYSTLSLKNNSSITAVNSDFIVGAATSQVTVDASSSLYVKDITNNGTITLTKGGVIGFETITIEADANKIALDGYTDSTAALVMDYTGTETKDMTYYASVVDISDTSKYLVKNNDLYYIGDSYNVYVNSTWTEDSCDGHIWGFDAFNSFNDAKAVNPDKINGVGGTFVTSLWLDGVATEITGGSFHDSSIYVFGGIKNEGIEARTWIDKTGSTSLTISDGTFDYVCGADWVQSGSLYRKGDSNLTINGGTIFKTVAGGMFYSQQTRKNSAYLEGNISLTITGGTIKGYVYGGDYITSRSKPYSSSNIVEGNITVTLDVTSNDITIGGNVFAGSYGFGSIIGNTNVTLKGTKSLTIGGGYISGGSGADSDTNGKTDTLITGSRSIVFDAFKGKLDAKLFSFTDAVFKNGSEVDFQNTASSKVAEINTWNFEAGSKLTGLQEYNNFTGDTLTLTGFDLNAGEDAIIIDGVSEKSLQGWNNSDEVKVYINGSMATYSDALGWCASGYSLHLDEQDKSNLIISKLA